MTSTPLPLAKASDQDLQPIEALFFDIDDTFSTHSKIHADAYYALWKLYEAGIKVIPVTGRPAGWCDLITRMWPVTAVVGENGAFYSSIDAKGILRKRYLEDEKTRAKNAKKLMALSQAIAKKFPKARTPSDQRYREFDLAIDYCEDVRRWPESEVNKLITFARKNGAIAKLSSIHVNIWYGQYDKWTCVELLMKEMLKLNPAQDLHRIAYVGDSPNDEPFFMRLPFSVGVANVQEFLSKMQFHPSYITKSRGGQGFAELALKLLERK